MTSEKLNEFLNNMKLEKGKWVTLYDIDRIELRGGIGVYPNWRFMRFLFTDNEVLVRHGNSKPYGARLNTKFMFSMDYCSVSFQYGPLIASVNTHEDFRNPKTGDILVATNESGIIVSESIISRVTSAINGHTIHLANPVAPAPGIFLSFYDPTCFNPETSIHGKILTGVYTTFVENPGSKHKKYGVYHEIIKIKNIESFDLKLISNKTYNVK